MISIGTSNDSTRICWVEEALKQVPAGSRILDGGAGDQQFKKFFSRLGYVFQSFAQYDGKDNSVGKRFTIG